MATQFNDNIDFKSPKAADNRLGKFSAGKWRPYNDIAEALASVTLYRYEGLTLPIRKTGNKIDLYWFEGGVLDSNFVQYKQDIDLTNYYTKAEIDSKVLSLQADIALVQVDIDVHEARNDNPHNTTKLQIGLGNVDNTPDATKPISGPTQTALNNKVDKVPGKGLSSEDFTLVEKSKLSGIQDQATKNQNDAYLLDRTNHTNTQPISTVIALQSTLDGKIPLTQKGVAGGVATLDNSGKVPASQLPVGPQVYQGLWNPITNSPSLADGVGVNGWTYRVTQTATRNLGSGPINFLAGDDIIYNGSIWQRNPSVEGVISVNSKTGAVVLTKTDLSLGNVDNTTDLNKPISTATQTALNNKVDKEQGKGLSTNDYSNQDKTRLLNTSGLNTGDQDLSGLEEDIEYLKNNQLKRIQITYSDFDSDHLTYNNTFLVNTDYTLEYLGSTSGGGSFDRGAIIEGYGYTKLLTGGFKLNDNYVISENDVFQIANASSQLVDNSNKANVSGQVFTGPILATNLSGINTGDQDYIKISLSDLESDNITYINNSLKSNDFSLTMNGIGLLQEGIHYNVISDGNKGFVLINGLQLGINDFITLVGTSVSTQEDAYTDLTINNSIVAPTKSSLNTDYPINIFPALKTRISYYNLDLLYERISETNWIVIHTNLIS